LVELIFSRRDFTLDLAKIGPVLAPLRDWLTATAHPGDFVLIQGDFGAAYLMVNFALEKGLIPIYSTTRRSVEEERLSDGSVKLVRRFRHERFRIYGR
jgi:hypothetical protein